MWRNGNLLGAAMTGSLLAKEQPAIQRLNNKKIIVPDHGIICPKTMRRLLTGPADAIRAKIA
jgi:hypothetical protein